MDRKNEAIWIESRQRWEIQVQRNGVRPKFISDLPGKKGKVNAERQADKWIESGIIDKTTRVDKLFDKWIEELKLSTSRDHWSQYESYGKNHIKPRIGAKKISRLTQKDLQNIINTAYNNPLKTKGKDKLSKKTLSNIRACLMSFIKYCRGEKVTNWHPETLIIPAGAKNRKKTILTVDDIKTLFTVSTSTWFGKPAEDMFIHAYRFLVLTGMRPGEMIGLKEGDIKGSRVTINRSINIRNEETDGKNENAQRTYTLDSHALKVLKEQKHMLTKMGWISPYIFPGYDRKNIKETTLYKAWKRYCAANGIENAKTPYELRHTFVSVNTNMPDSLKKLVVGHSENMDTQGIYGHEKAGDMDKAAAYISEAFTSILGW